MLTFVAIAGGVALILFGVRYLRKGLDRLFGNRLALWMQKLAGSRLRALFTGIGAAVLAPSSTTMSLLAVQTVQMGHLSPRRMLAVIFGADIGLTVLVQLIALPMEHVWHVFIAVGVLLFQFTERSHIRGIGQLFLALGFIFLGVFTIRGAFSPADVVSGEEGDLQKLIAIAEHYPIFMAVLAALIAMALQSGTATIAIVIGMGSSAALDVPMTAALAWVAGANVGLGLTMMVLGWGQLESRRLALGNLLAKLLTAALTLALLPWAAEALERTPWSFAFRIAHSHTLFNVVLAALGMVLLEPISRAAEYVFPAPRETDEPKFGPRHISDVASDSIVLALGASMREVMHVSEIVREMLRDLWRALRTDDDELARRVSDRDDQVDLLDSAIKRFLTRLGNLEGDPDSAAEQMRQLRYLTELETIGDILDKNLSELVLKKIRLQVEFSSAGWKELEDFYHKVSENMLIADTAFARGDRQLAEQLLRHKERLNQLERELRDRHFARLNAGLVESHETSAIHLDILTHLKRINSCVSHIAFATLQK